jgi:hypothetical protein
MSQILGAGSSFTEQMETMLRQMAAFQQHDLDERRRMECTIRERDTFYQIDAMRKQKEIDMITRALSAAISTWLAAPSAVDSTVLSFQPTGGGNAPEPDKQRHTAGRKDAFQYTRPASLLLSLSGQLLARREKVVPSRAKSDRGRLRLAARLGIHWPPTPFVMPAETPQPTKLNERTALGIREKATVHALIARRLKATWTLIRTVRE